MLTDPIADMLTRIRNASLAHKSEVVLPYSNLKYAIAKVLEGEGYIGEVKKVADGKFSKIEITVKYEADGPRIRNIRRVSKPGQRVYRKAEELPNVLSGFGIAVISTPNGVMTNKEAKKRRLGGEIICEVY